MLHLQNWSICTSRITNKRCKTSKTKKNCTYKGVERYSLHADDLNLFHLICPFHAICNLHGPKRNGGYCWLYKIPTGNDSNFTHNRITLVALNVMNDLTHANTIFKKNGLHNLLFRQKYYAFPNSDTVLDCLVMSHLSFLPIPVLRCHSNLTKRMTACVTYKTTIFKIELKIWNIVGIICNIHIW